MSVGLPGQKLTAALCDSIYWRGDHGIFDVTSFLKF